MKTLAITIGNNECCIQSLSLENAVNDARAMKDVFERLGYDTRHFENCNNTKFEEIETELKDVCGNYDAIIFYYAGHGAEIGGQNYLGSIECQINNNNEAHWRRNSLPINELLLILARSNDDTKLNNINIVIIDACRTRGNERFNHMGTS